MLRGYKLTQLPTSTPDKVSILRVCLERGKRVEIYCRALELDELATKTRMLYCGQLTPCVLHASARTTKKIMQQILLADLRKHSSGKDMMAFVTKV